MLRPRLFRIPPFPRVCRRNLNVPSLQNNLENGIKDFLSPMAVNIAYNEYQSLMLYRLNGLTAGTPLSWPVNLMRQYFLRIE